MVVVVRFPSLVRSGSPDGDHNVTVYYITII